MQPYNYNIEVARPFAESVKGFAVGQQLGQAIDQIKAAPAIEEAQQQAQQQAQDALNIFAGKANPTAQDYQRVLLFNPGLKDVIGEGWKAMSTERRKADFGFGAQVLAATAGGKVDVAEQLLTERATAARNSGDEEQAKLFDTYAKLVKINPAAAERGIGMMLAAVDPDGFDKAYGAITSARVSEAKLPTEIAGAEAEIAYKEGQTQRLADMTELEAARVGIARETLDLEVSKAADAALAAREAAGAPKLSPGMEKAIDDAVMGAATAASQARSTAALLGKMRLEIQRDPVSGLGARIDQAISRGVIGYDDMTALRTQLEGFINSRAIENLPPGVATDKDIALAREGLPPATAPLSSLVSFVQAAERLQKAAAITQNARAAWISANGNTGTLRRDAEIQGQIIPAGTDFNSFVQKFLSDARAKERNWSR